MITPRKFNLVDYSNCEDDLTTIPTNCCPEMFLCGLVELAFSAPGSIQISVTNSRLYFTTEYRNVGSRDGPHEQFNNKPSEERIKLAGSYSENINKSVLFVTIISYTFEYR